MINLARERQLLDATPLRRELEGFQAMPYRSEADARALTSVIKREFQRRAQA